MTYSRALPEAMGYTAISDSPAGYGVFRTLVRPNTNDAGMWKVWNPRDDSAQCFDVLCWLMGDQRVVNVDWSGVDVYDAWYASHDATPASLRAAIVEAAERVADAKGDK
jgi:hypothetical protein